MIHSETARVLEGALIDGQYRLHYQIGEGGMGTVWAAEDLRLGRMVAAKFLSKHMAAQPRVRERFQREARMTARVRSTHVVQVFAEGCTAQDIPYLIMELLDGEDLAAHLKRVGRCGLRETSLIVEQICRGLSQAHSEGLVHRDVKPHNIFLSTAETDAAPPIVKLLDFGIAKDLAALADSLTGCGEVVGSALYCSPEQLRDPQSVDHSSDIWAIGIVIFELLTGRVPYEASSLSELIELHRARRFPKVSSVVSGLPRELDVFLERTLHAAPSKRWASVEELAQHYCAIVRKHGAAIASDPAFSATELPPSAAARASLSALTKPGGVPLRRVFVLVALVLLCSVAALARTQTSANPAAARRVARQPPIMIAPKPVVNTAAGATEPVTQPFVPNSQELAPPPKAAVPRTSKTAPRPARRPNPPAQAPVQLEKPSPIELPGRNHGF